MRCLNCNAKRDFGSLLCFGCWCHPSKLDMHRIAEMFQALVVRERRCLLMEREQWRIDAKIAQLEQQRDAVLTLDEKYASYVESYRTFYSDEPLSPRQYYEAMAELAHLKAQSQRSDADETTLFLKHGGRLQQLERMLAV